MMIVSRFRLTMSFSQFANEFYIQLEDSSSLPVADRRKLMAANGAILGRFKSALNILVK